MNIRIRIRNNNTNTDNGSSICSMTPTKRMTGPVLLVIFILTITYYCCCNYTSVVTKFVDLLQQQNCKNTTFSTTTPIRNRRYHTLTKAVSTPKLSTTRASSIPQQQKQQQQQQQQQKTDGYEQITVYESFLDHLQTLDDIPKIVHITFTNATKLPDLVDKFDILKYDVVGRALKDEGWELRLYEHDDMIQLVETAVNDKLIPHEEFELLTYIVELTDVIRVLLMYTAGGIYMDIDRLINIPLDELVGKVDHRPSISPQSQIINPKMVCLTNQDHHFMQDIMISSKGNRLYKEVLNRMTRQRLKLPRKGGCCHDKDCSV
mmetsp:Transcript_60439/g.148315  ORF Transcript_60439/g.148315 Transcript_60439/m.148315 type:complete len:319 (-) Transcript_60439:372-1328(-)